MACSPKRPDPLRDAEARVRALTREVGTLREDLRREVKRRERASAQSREAEDAKKELESRVNELAYSNRKLAGELDALHEAARAGAERDRRALRGLREGLAAVEAAVAARARKGATQVRLLQEAQQGLRQLLFSGGAAAAAGGGGGGATAIGSDLLANVTGISSAAAPRAEALLGSAQAAAGRLAALLLGAEGDGLPGAGGEEEGEEEEEEVEAGRLAGGAGAGGGGRLAFDMEKEQLKDEVVRLRAEMRLLSDKAAGSASCAALELASSLRAAQDEVGRLRGELLHANAEAAAAAREREALAGALEEARRRLQQQDELQSAMVAAARQQEDGSLGRVAELTAKRVALEGEVSSLSQQLAAVRQQLMAALGERAELEAALAQRESELRLARANILEQGADIRSALTLISRPPGAAAAASAASLAPPPPHAHTTPGGPAGAGGAALGSGAAGMDATLAAALAPYQNASAVIGSALAAAAAIVPVDSGGSAGRGPAWPPGLAGAGAGGTGAGAGGSGAGGSGGAVGSALSDMTSLFTQWPGLASAKAAFGGAGGTHGAAATAAPTFHGQGPEAQRSFSFGGGAGAASGAGAGAGGFSARGLHAPAAPPHAADGAGALGFGGKSWSLNAGPGAAVGGGGAGSGGAAAARSPRRQAAVDEGWSPRGVGARAGGREGGGGGGHGRGMDGPEEELWRGRRRVGGGAEALLGHAMRGGGGGGGGAGAGGRGGGGGGGGSGKGRLAALRRDMACLDDEIAAMEASLSAAAGGGGRR